MTNETEGGSIQAPAISLPKGGGAIKGIDEKFTVNPSTGTASLSIPIFTSPSRSDFYPKLSISYDSGAGNGPFGFGWNLSLPSITRRTDKGIPQYYDSEESDVFILSGAEDLVPVLEESAGQWVRLNVSPLTIDETTYNIHRYRPRIEGLFARIELWTNDADPRDPFWRSISRDNITTWYGKTGESRISDPADPTRIFSWLLCESYDDKGNAIVYEYEEENSTGVAFFRAHEKKEVVSQPSLAYLSGGQQQFMDLAGDGKLDLVHLSNEITGYYERDDSEGWNGGFRPFRSRSNVNFQDINLRLVDLNGDGHADILITENEVFVWYPSLAEGGFGPAGLVSKPDDEEYGPALVFADGTQTIFLADMSGDGLQDIARIRNGEVAYWPNLGYGRFGAKVTMDDSPFFDTPDLFDPTRIRLADVDGSGNTDIIYLDYDQVRIWRDRSGNSWDPPEPVVTPPAFICSPQNGAYFKFAVYDQ